MRLTPKRLAVTGMTAAVYAALTAAVPVLSYGEIQCRFSEALNLLIFINPVFAPGVVLGCFIANLFSPIGVPDWIFGTLATALSALLIIKFSKNLLTASLWPVVINGIVIGAEILVFFSDPPMSPVKYAGFAGAVMLGQAVAVTLIGVPLFSQVMKNEKLLKILREI